MKRFLAISATTLSLLAAPLTGASAQAPSNQPSTGSEITGRHVARGTVSAIDLKKDEVTVKTEDGREMKFSVEPATAQRLKKGDKIEVAVEMKITRPTPK